MAGRPREDHGRRAAAPGGDGTILGPVTVPPPEPPPGYRISDADRERAAARLNQALAEGRITVGELDERLSVVYAARFEADLRPPLADLPPLSAVAMQVMTPSGPPLVLRAGMSGLKRAGAWEVPARLRVQGGMGAVVLDFCDADIPHPVVEVELDMGAGSARLLVPDAATANVDDMVTSMGQVKSSVPSRPRPGAPHFVVHGRSSIGSVTIRRRYRMLGHWF